MPQNMLPGWSLVDITGKAADLFEPVSPRFGLIWLHGQDEASPSGNDKLTASLRNHRISCIAPHGGQSWWVGSEEMFLLNDVLPWIAERGRFPTRGVAVAGVEMGGQGAIRLALKFPKVFAVAAGLGSALDYHELHGRGTPLDAIYTSRERARQDTATLHMHPSEWPPYLWFACDPADPWYRGNDRLHEKLRAYGVPHTADLESSGSDDSDAMLNPMLEFMADGLERESRRLM